MPARIPFVDLITPHLELQEELLAVFRASLRSGKFIGGSMVEDFEREFARYCGSRFCIGVSSGREALRLALLAGGVRPGDIVLTVPNTLVSIVEAILQAGAQPDFIDVDEHTCSMDLTELEEHLQAQCCVDPATGRLLDKRTHAPLAALVPAHLHGQTANMDPILEIAERYGLFVIEDACQAHGAEYFSKKENRWRRAGVMGHAAVFSFDPGANLGACGEAGTVTTNDENLAQRLRMLRDHGAAQEADHDPEGQGAGLDAIQAGILEVKLRHLAEWEKKRRENAFCYHGLLSSAVDSITIPYEPSWAKATYHSYVIRLENRDELRAHLHAANIATKVQCPLLLHLQDAYGVLRYKSGEFPVAEKIASQNLALPIYPQLEFDQQYRIAQKILEFVTHEKATRSPVLHAVASFPSP
jgi:dTDP-4-amino-4,6-dideoxygalactose transaminase